MPPLKSAGAAARAASRRRALARPKSVPRRKPARKKPAPRDKPRRRKTMAPRGPAAHSPAFRIEAPPREADPFAKPTGARLAYYAPEFLAEARRRVEQTLQSTSAIARDFGIHHDVLARLIRRFGWVRPEGSLAANLSPAMRLAAKANALVAQAPPTPNPSPPRAPRAGGGERTERAAPPSLGDTAIDQLEAEALEQLARVQQLRANSATEPLQPTDAERNARTLASLTDTIAKLRRLRIAGQPQQDETYDDMPADIDEFRDELARRLEALFASGSDKGDTGAD